MRAHVTLRNDSSQPLASPAVRRRSSLKPSASKARNYLHAADHNSDADRPSARSCRVLPAAAPVELSLDIVYGVIPASTEKRSDISRRPPQQSDWTRSPKTSPDAVSARRPYRYRRAAGLGEGKALHRGGRQNCTANAQVPSILPNTWDSAHAAVIDGHFIAIPAPRSPTASFPGGHFLAAATLSFEHSTCFSRRIAHEANGMRVLPPITTNQTYRAIDRATMVQPPSGNGLARRKSRNHLRPARQATPPSSRGVTATGLQHSNRRSCQCTEPGMAHISSRRVNG